MADNIQFRMFCIQPLRNMSPCDKMNLSHPWRIFLHPAKPVPEIIPISVPFFSIIRIYRYIHICVSQPCSLFSLPFQVISIYPGNNKIYILRVLIYFSHVLFPTYHFVSISIPYLFSLLQIKRMLFYETLILTETAFPSLMHFLFYEKLFNIFMLIQSLMSNKAGIYLCFPIFFSIASGTLIKPNRHSIG